VFHLIQLLLNLLLKIDGDLPDNSRLAGTIFIGGLWLLLIAKIFPQQLGRWPDGCLWVGWICVGLATFMVVRRKMRNWQGKDRKSNASAILR